MDRKQYFEELHIALTRGGFTSQPEQDELLPVEWDGLPLCRITADGGVRYWQEDVAMPERERACERATDLACTVREYMTLLEQAPPLQAQSLTGDYRLLADFNGAVLAAHPTRLGVQSTTQNIYPLTSRIQCSECGSYFRRRQVSGTVKWGCSKHIQDRTQCGSNYYSEERIYDAFVAMVNKLRFSEYDIMGQTLLRLESAELKRKQKNTAARGAQPEHCRSERQVGDGGAAPCKGIPQR